MATVTITSDTASLFSHDVYFELEVDDVSADSYSSFLVNMGSLKYENEVPNNSDNPTDIGIKGGQIDVKFEKYLSDGTSLPAVLQDAFEYVSKPDDWSGKMYWREKGGSYGDPIRFLFNFKDIDINEEVEEVEISLRPYTNDIGDVYDFFGTYSGDIDVYDITFSVNTWDAQLSGEFIKLALEKIYGTSTIEFFSGIFSEGTPSSGDEWFVSKEIQGNANNEESVVSHVSKMAAFEGALYGSSLGKPFYVNRKNTDASLEVTLDYDDVVKIQTTPFYDSIYKNIHISQTVNANEVTARAVSASATDEDINIAFISNGLNLVTLTSGSAGNYKIPDTTIIDEGVDNYSLAFGFVNPKQVEVEYWGIGSIYSYSTIVIGADAPVEFRGNYKIKEIDYDWKMDKVKMILYNK